MIYLTGDVKLSIQYIIKVGKAKLPNFDYVSAKYKYLNSSIRYLSLKKQIDLQIYNQYDEEIE